MAVSIKKEKEQQEEKDKKDKGDKGHKGKDGDKGQSKGLPPGLAKRDSLPPGLQKQLDKNGRLPPGLAKRDLPEDLASKLPRRDGSQDVTIVDNDVVLIDRATGVILDVLNDVIVGTGGQTTVPTTNPDGTLRSPGPQTQDRGESDSAMGKFLKGIFGGN